MGVLCINCEKAELRPSMVKLAGIVRSEPYWVEMQGLKCPNCGYNTVDASGMTEFSRLLSDEYRRTHGLLTSDQITELRKKFGMNQQRFADHIGVGVASIKRWELGKIQDNRSNDLILERTREKINSSSDLVIVDIASYSTTAMGGSYENTTNGIYIEPASQFVFVIGQIWGTCGAPFGNYTATFEDSNPLLHSTSGSWAPPRITIGTSEAQGCAYRNAVTSTPDMHSYSSFSRGDYGAIEATRQARFH
jgi:putative zinc finger/helix-turn-helix YgiT family protein